MFDLMGLQPCLNNNEEGWTQAKIAQTIGEIVEGCGMVAKLPNTETGLGMR